MKIVYTRCFIPIFVSMVLFLACSETESTGTNGDADQIQSDGDSTEQELGDPELFEPEGEDIVCDAGLHRNF